MFRYRAVAKVNPSNSCNTVLIFGRGNGFLTYLLFSSLKSVKKCTVPYFFIWINDGAAHSEDGCHTRTPNSQSLFISLRIVSLSAHGMGNALP